ncbi:hypothetical protein CgunFtcFv8_007493 [Champsocephalus gunnari]|nr:hypothetical protein CgunFtcFv8_007493 [Champsocephalus gunnari]
MVQTDRETDSFFPLWLFGLLLFLSVCLLLLQLIVYLSWKIRQVEEDVLVENRSAIYRQMNRSADRSKRSVG